MSRPLWACAALLSAALAVSVGMLPLLLAHRGSAGADLLWWNAVAFGLGVGASALMAPVWGALADRVGTRWMVLRAAAGLAVTQVLLWAAPGPAAVVGVRLLQGLVSGAMPAVIAHAVALAPTEHRGRWLGDLEAAASVGGLVGAGAAAVTCWFAPLPTVYLGASAAAVLAGGCALLTGAGEPTARETTERMAWGALGGWLGVSVCIEAGQQLVELSWPVLLVQLAPEPEVQATVVAAVEGVSEGAYLLAAPVVGRLADRSGTVSTVRVAAVTSGIGSLLLVLAPGPWWLLPGTLVADGASAGVHPLIGDVVADTVPRHRQSAALGLLASAKRVGGGMGAVLAPLLAPFGASVAIGVGAGLVAGVGLVGVTLSKEGRA